MAHAVPRVNGQSAIRYGQHFPSCQPRLANRHFFAVNSSDAILGELNAHHTNAPCGESVMDVDLPTRTLMQMTESLGENCEYGFWQRHRGHESSSLFRWAITRIDNLLAFLEAPQHPQYAMDNLSPYSPGMVTDATFGIKFHSKLVERDADERLRLLSDPITRTRIHADEGAKIARTRQSGHRSAICLKSDWKTSRCITRRFPTQISSAR